MKKINDVEMSVSLTVTAFNKSNFKRLLLVVYANNYLSRIRLTQSKVALFVFGFRLSLYYCWPSDHIVWAFVIPSLLIATVIFYSISFNLRVNKDSFNSFRRFQSIQTVFLSEGLFPERKDVYELSKIDYLISPLFSFSCLYFYFCSST